MQCPNCGFDNPVGMNFCGECGMPLQQRCPQCGFDNPPRFKFCGQCGAAILKAEGGGMNASREIIHPSSSTLHPSSFIPHPSHRAERRHLTVMFCDLVGSTTLSEQLDPEELREVLRVYQQTCATVIDRFGGTIAQYLGDGLLVYFGYPQAHEDDAQRAVRAGLGIVAELKQLNAQRRQMLKVELAVRLGIHTGLVVVGEIGTGERREQLAIGETINLAARLQALTAPNTIAISAVTGRLVKDFFVCQSMGSHSLKGLSQLAEVYQVLRERRARSRLRAAAISLTPLVGREQELDLLLARWEQVKERRGQVALLSGEPGIGKSRLVQTLKERIAGEPHLWLECRCSPYHQHSALYPVIELLQRLLRFKEKEAPTQKLDKLERRISELAGPASDPIQLTRETGQSVLSEALVHPAPSPVIKPGEVVLLLATLLSLPPSERTPPLNLTPQRQKQKTLEALLAILLKLAVTRPVCVLVEDLHWVDPSTLEMLNFLVEQAATARVLVLFTARPEFDPSWQSWSHLTQLTLHRLGQQQTQAMVEAVTGGRAMPTEVMHQLITKTDGVPLFVEELTKMVLELGLLREQAKHYELIGSLPPLAIPATLQESLMARLDRLATVREVAQLGATIGREFSYELLRAISPFDEISLQHGLARLVEAELLYQQGAPPQAVYTFKHALIQDTAYHSLLRSQRQRFHQQIAYILAEHFPEITQTQPELLAYHYTAAGLTEQAIGYWQQAGERAMARSANVEAIGHLTQAITLLKTLPDTSERAQQELSLQISLGVPLLMTKGYASATIEQTYVRVRELCQQADAGETPQLFSALFGLWLFHLVRAELAAALELAQQLWQVAERLNEMSMRLEAHQAQGVTLFYLGEIAAAQAHLEQVITQYHPQQHPAHAAYGGADLGVTCLCHAALALWLQGFPDQAVKRSQEVLALAHDLAQPFSLAFALCLTGWLHQFRRERTLTYERAVAAMALSTEHGFALSSAFGMVLAGWAGEGEAGLSQLRQGLVAYQATGAELGRLQFLSLLAEGYSQSEQVEAGLAVLDEVLATASQNGERFFEAELYRLKGELLLKAKGGRMNALREGARSGMKDKAFQKAQDEAEACFQRAIEIAKQQEAKSLELRAVMSLGRLWWERGKQVEAHHLLAEVYRWFKEGLDTADLKEAKVLLAKMAKICDA